MDRTACTQPQRLYKGDLYLYLYLYLITEKSITRTLVVATCTLVLVSSESSRRPVLLYVRIRLCKILSQFETEFDPHALLLQILYFSTCKKIAEGTKHTLIQATWLDD